MSMTTAPVDNGVNVEALLGAREALTAAPEAAHRRVALLLLPYVEGYSITGPALADDPSEAVQMLMELIEAMEQSTSR